MNKIRIMVGMQNVCWNTHSTMKSLFSFEERSKQFEKLFLIAWKMKSFHKDVDK